MTDLVNAGYNDGKGLSTDPAIPVNPTITRPMKPFSSLSALNSGDLQDEAQQGASAGAETFTGHLADPSSFITGPLGEIGKLPGLSTLTNSSVSSNSLASAKSAAPETKTATTGSSNSERPKPLKKIADDFNSSLKKFADAVNPKKAAPESNDESD
jgi:hypothetical protein